MNKVDERLVTVSVSLPAAVVKLLDELATGEKRSRSFYMRKFIENALTASDDRKAG